MQAYAAKAHLPAILSEKESTALFLMGVVKAKSSESKALALQSQQFAPIYQEGTQGRWLPNLGSCTPQESAEGSAPDASRQ